MYPARVLRRRVEAGEVVTGLLVTFHLWPGLVEIARRAGLDYIIVDREHGPHSDELTAEVCAVGRYLGFAVLIRPIDTDYSTVRRAVDLGSCGLLLPTVESAAELDRVRSTIRLPPRGKRRPGGHGNYWLKSFDRTAWRTEVEDDFLVLPQIESSAGLSKVEEIASHEITTAIAVGPYDLSADLGVCGEMEHPRLVEAENRIREAGLRAGKTMWHIGDPETLRARGFSFLCIGEPSVILEQAMRTTREAIR